MQPGDCLRLRALVSGGRNQAASGEVVGRPEGIGRAPGGAAARDGRLSITDGLLRFEGATLTEMTGCR